jgi:hypothetical protein
MESQMSTLEVKLYRVHPQPLVGTDRLSTVQVEGYTAIVGRDQFQDNDLAIFVPYDAVVPENIRQWLRESSKIEVHGGRIRCAKIRGFFSDGLCLPLSIFEYLGIGKIIFDNKIEQYKLLVLRSFH